ncbi:MAG: hypothetical protein V1762_03565 [Nitrospirota bacterium]
MAYVESTYQNWTFIPKGHNLSSGYYATEKQHVEEAQRYIEKAEKLKFNDAELTAHIRSVKENIHSMYERKFYGNWLVTGIWFLIGLVLLGQRGGAGGGLFFLAVASFYFYASRPPQFLLNRKVIKGQSPTGGFDGIIWVIALYPLMAAWNYYNNYLSVGTLHVTSSAPSGPTASPPVREEDVRVEPPGTAKKVDEVPTTEPVVSTDAHAEQPITEQQADILRSIIEIIDSSLIQGEYTPDIRNYIRAKGKEFGITEEASDALLLEKLVEKGFSPEEEGTFDILSVRCYTAAKKPIDKKTPLPEPEIKPEEPPVAQAQASSKISDQEKPRMHQEVQDDTPGPIAAANLERDKFDEKKKTKRNPTILIAAAVGIILVIFGFFYYNNNNKVKMEQLQKELTQKEERLREEAKRAEDAARKAEIERQKAEKAQAEAAREIAEKEAAAREAATRVSAMQEADRLASVKSLQDGRRYFEKLCVEKMKEVLRRDRNNREAERYVQMAQQMLNEAKRQFQNLKFGGQE